MSPTIFTYKGIHLQFFSSEHLPIHVHAFYGDDFGMRVEFHPKGDLIQKIDYKGLKGYKTFAPAQLRDLKVLIERYKFEVVKDWLDVFIYKKKVKTKKINRIDKKP